MRPRRDRRHFADDIFKCVFLNENEWISLRISLKSVPKVWINNIPSLVQIMAWRRPGDKPLSEPMMVSLPTHLCVTRPQWVNAVCVAAILKLDGLGVNVITWDQILGKIVYDALTKEDRKTCKPLLTKYQWKWCTGVNINPTRSYKNHSYLCRQQNILFCILTHYIFTY